MQLSSRRRAQVPGAVWAVYLQHNVKHVELGWSGLGPLYSYQEPPELDGPIESYTRLTRYSHLSKKERAEREGKEKVRCR